MSHSRNIILVLALVYASCANVWIALHRSHTTSLSREVSPKNYTWIDEDYPEYLFPENTLRKVAMQTEETVFYSTRDRNLSHAWDETMTRRGNPRRWFKLGPYNHVYLPSMYHEFHCLQNLHHALQPSDHHFESDHVGHWHHCLSYIRQMVLCDPDLTLEPWDALDRDFERDRAGVTHVCNDWTAVFEIGDNSQEEWTRWKEKAWKSD